MIRALCAAVLVRIAILVFQVANHLLTETGGVDREIALNQLAHSTWLKPAPASFAGLTYSICLIMKFLITGR